MLSAVVHMQRSEELERLKKQQEEEFKNLEEEKKKMEAIQNRLIELEQQKEQVIDWCLCILSHAKNSVRVRCAVREDCLCLHTFLLFLFPHALPLPPSTSSTTTTIFSDQ